MNVDRKVVYCNGAHSRLLDADNLEVVFNSQHLEVVLNSQQLQITNLHAQSPETVKLIVKLKGQYGVYHYRLSSYFQSYWLMCILWPLMRTAIEGKSNLRLPYIWPTSQFGVWCGAWSIRLVNSPGQSHIIPLWGWIASFRGSGTVQYTSKDAENNKLVLCAEGPCPCQSGQWMIGQYIWNGCTL